MMLMVIKLYGPFFKGSCSSDLLAGTAVSVQDAAEQSAPWELTDGLRWMHLLFQGCAGMPQAVSVSQVNHSFPPDGSGSREMKPLSRKQLFMASECHFSCSRL